MFIFQTSRNSNLVFRYQCKMVFTLITPIHESVNIDAGIFYMRIIRFPCKHTTLRSNKMFSLLAFPNMANGIFVKNI